MISFKTEFEINGLPENYKEDYVNRAYTAIISFLGENAPRFKETIGYKYNTKHRSNVFYFSWNDSLYSGPETGETRVLAACKEMKTALKSNKFLKKFSVREITTTYNIKN